MTRSLRYSGSAILVAGSLLLVGCSPQETNASPANDVQGDVALPSESRVINVEVTPVRLTNFTDYIRITGEAEAAFDVTISAEESGVVQEFLAEKGSFVRRGAALIRLDDGVLSAQVDEARASAALAGERYARQRQLWEQEGIGSEIAYLEARYQSQIADARLALLELRLDKTLIAAPVDGYLDERYVEIGEMAAAGTPVARVVSTDRIKVSGGIPERFAPFVRVGDTARVRFDILPDGEYVGLISYVGSTVDERNRTFPIEVELDNPGGIVKPHMVANVEVVRESAADVAVVHQTVVVRTSEGYEVFLAQEDDSGDFYAIARPVTLGPSYNNQVVVTEGIEVGDLVVTLGQQMVDDGSRLHVVNREQIAQQENE